MYISLSENHTTSNKNNLLSIRKSILQRKGGPDFCAAYGVTWKMFYFLWLHLHCDIIELEHIVILKQMTS
jgi:hypothetical protein